MKEKIDEIYVYLVFISTNTSIYSVLVFSIKKEITFRLGVFLRGRALSHSCFSLFLISTICLSSCEDDLERGKTSTSISFTPEIQAGWSPLARSMTGTDMPRGSVSPLQGGRTPLYLHTLYTDSIAVSSFSKGKDAAVRMTRAARVSAENMYDHFGVSAYAYTRDWEGGVPESALANRGIGQ